MSAPMSISPDPSIVSLLAGIVDYAGLFPPAKLEMPTAVRNFARYQEHTHAWMLARFVVPVARLAEFEAAASEWLPRSEEDEPWHISALPGPDLEADIDAVFAFNRVHAEDADAGLAVIDAMEIRAPSPDYIDQAMLIIPEQIDPFFEVPWQSDPRGYITAAVGTGAAMKIRTGGVSPDLIPPTHVVARFIHTCAAAPVRFKATAGLHHPVRGEYCLTYEDNAPTAVMHGFLNVFIASLLARARKLDERTIKSILDETDPGAFTVSPEAIAWRELDIAPDDAERLRGSFVTSFGSCSFEEPIEDLAGLGLL